MKDFAIILIACGIGAVAGKILMAIRGDNWRHSKRGLLFAIILIGMAVGLLAVNFQN